MAVSTCLGPTVKDRVDSGANPARVARVEPDGFDRGCDRDDGPIVKDLRAGRVRADRSEDDLGTAAAVFEGLPDGLCVVEREPGTQEYRFARANAAFSEVARTTDIVGKRCPEAGVSQPSLARYLEVRTRRPTACGSFGRMHQTRPFHVLEPTASRPNRLRP